MVAVAIVFGQAGKRIKEQKKPALAGGFKTLNITDCSDHRHHRYHR